MIKKGNVKNWLGLSCLVIFYLILHLPKLSLLPVFADEAIYIRWAQLIMDDWSRYLFFPLNDGKTPLFIWLLVPFQYIFSDQLIAGRFLAVIIGLLQVASIGLFTKQLGGRNKTSWLAMFLTSILPYWYFHHRVALIDGLMTLLITLTLNAVIWLKQHPEKFKFKIRLRGILWGGMAFGAALLTKIPAILALGSFASFSIFSVQIKNKKNNHYVLPLNDVVNGLAMFILGILIFLLLKLNPAFGQLFSRGSDFLYPWQDVLFKGMWKQTVINIPTYLSYFGHYLSWSIILLNLYGLFSPTLKKQQWLLLVSAATFSLPMMILGRVVYPRYFLPVALFSTVSAALAIQEIVDLYVTQQKKMTHQILVTMILVSLLSGVISASFNFIYPSLTNANQIPFVAADKVQYLTEWSAGHGIKQVSDDLLVRAKQHSVAAATEGFFGTLPDGVVLYLHNRDVTNLYVDGIGQPVMAIPEKFKNKAKNYDQTLLIVNSHRMGLKLEQDQFITEYCRPDNAPCLQVWDITRNIKNPSP